MSKPTPRSPYREEDVSSRPLADRVRDRVTAAEERLAELTMEPDVSPATLALWQVFDEFGDARREQRRRTGAPAIPALRSATIAFRRDPSLDSLVAVAVFLDEQGLLQPSQA